MDNEEDIKRKENSYYSLYLSDYLTEKDDPRKDDKSFIESRNAMACDAYEKARLNGVAEELAQEMAMEVLFKGI